MLVDSRVTPTGQLASALAALPDEQRPSVLVSGSAIGYYGDRGDQMLTEDSTAGPGFLDVAIYYPDYSPTWRFAQIGLSALSGLVVAGLGSWALTLALARTGVLDRFPSGRERVAV